MAIPIAQPKKRKYFPGSDDQSALFSGFDSGVQNDSVGSMVNENVKGMISGNAFDPIRTKERETLQRAATDLRAQSGAANAGALGQGKANRVQGGVERTIFQGLADTEMGLDIAEQETKERGIGLATDIGAQEQQIQTQRRGQDVDLTQGRESRQSAEAIGKMQLAGNEKIAARSAALDEKKLTETARQFNVSTQEVAKQFSENLKLNYDELSVADKQFLATLGLDKEKFETSKQQFQQQLEQEGRLTLADLNIKEKGIAETARQFDNRLDFDRSELASSLSEAEKNRVWQATQNLKAAENTAAIAQMQNETDRWKTEQTDILTRAGWSQEASEAILDRRFKEVAQNKEIALTREVESGRLSQADKELVQKASEFRDKLDWEKEATRLGISNDSRDRAWQTMERISNQAYLSSEANADRQLQREVEEGRINQADEELYMRAMQFDKQLDWEKEAKLKDISQEDKMAIWEAAERSKDRIYNANAQQLQNEFAEKGWNFDAMMSAVDSFPAETRFDMVRTMAVEAGMSYPATDKSGELLKDNNGNQITVPGLRPVKTQTFDIDGWEPGEIITGTKYNALERNFNTLVDEGKAISDTSIEDKDPVRWTTAGYDRWVLTDEMKNWITSNTGKLYKASNGKIYEVVGASNLVDRHTKGSVIFKDVNSGITTNYTRGNGFPGEKA